MKRANLTSQAALPVDEGVAKSTPLTQLIAYLSLFMLAAAFGAMVGPVWCRCWAVFGTFGLASATGLDVLDRSRARSAAQARRTLLVLNAERKLDEIMGDMESFGTIRAALRQLQEDAAGPTAQGAHRRVEPRLPLDKPARITRLIQHSSGAIQRKGEPLAGRLRNVSRQGFGLVHDERLERGLVLLEIDFGGGASLQLIGDLLWCELQDGGHYFSGGKILEAANSSDSQAARSAADTKGVKIPAQPRVDRRSGGQ